MDRKRQSGYLVFADIAGYTSFVASTELDHAHEILSELLELIVDRLAPPLTVLRFEGDAVFAYAPKERLPRGETLVESIESAYAAFRDRLENIRRRTTCTCRACRAAPNLDLNFFVHYGEYMEQHVGGSRDLLGPDVNVVSRRRLKAPISQATSWRGYAVFTSRSIEQLGLSPNGMQAQSALVEHVGEIRTHTIHLDERYKGYVASRRTIVSPQEADVVFSYDLSAPPPTVWDWLNDPYKRMQWMPGRAWRVGLRSGGRTGPGAVNHCAHSKGEILETILDWRPFEYLTVRRERPPARGGIVITSRLKPRPEGGTHFEESVKLELPLPRWLSRPLCRLIVNAYKFPQDHERLVRLTAEAARSAEPAA